jgi:hypothetical protein
MGTGPHHLEMASGWRVCASTGGIGPVHPWACADWRSDFLCNLAAHDMFAWLFVWLSKVIMQAQAAWLLN